MGDGSSSVSLGTNGMRHLVTATTIRAIVEAIAVVSGDARLAGLVLTVLSSPPTPVACTSFQSRETHNSGPIPHNVGDAPCVLVLHTLHFDLVEPSPTALQ